MCEKLYTFNTPKILIALVGHGYFRSDTQYYHCRGLHNLTGSCSTLLTTPCPITTTLLLLLFKEMSMPMIAIQWWCRWCHRSYSHQGKMRCCSYPCRWSDQWTDGKPTSKDHEDTDLTKPRTLFRFCLTCAWYSLKIYLKQIEVYSEPTSSAGLLLILWVQHSRRSSLITSRTLPWTMKMASHKKMINVILKHFSTMIEQVETEYYDERRACWLSATWMGMKRRMAMLPKAGCSTWLSRPHAPLCMPSSTTSPTA